MRIDKKRFFEGTCKKCKQYTGKIIDLYFGNDHKAALEFGRQELEVEIVE